MDSNFFKGGGVFSFLAKLICLYYLRGHTAPFEYTYLIANEWRTANNDAQLILNGQQR